MSGISATVAIADHEILSRPYWFRNVTGRGRFPLTNTHVTKNYRFTESGKVGNPSPGQLLCRRSTLAYCMSQSVSFGGLLDNEHPD
jgi:hypothetical protein